MSNEDTTYGTPRQRRGSERKLLSEFDPTPRIMFYVYILKKINSTDLYYGYTNNLGRRTIEHNKDLSSWEMVCYEAYKSESDARNRERQLKHYGQALIALKQRLKDSLS